MGQPSTHLKEKKIIKFLIHIIYISNDKSCSGELIRTSSETMTKSVSPPGSKSNFYFEQWVIDS